MLLAALTILALAVPLPEAGNPALTPDEFTSLLVTRAGWGSLLIDRRATDTHRPSMRC